jgi:uncharacterized protein
MLKMKKSLQASVVSIAMLIGSFSGALADYDAGMKAVRDGDYVAAMRIFLPLAEQGNSPAQVNVGILFSDGKGVIRDEKEAVKWFRKAAKQGNSGGQLQLGSRYSNGWGVPKNYGEAAKWFHKAGEQGLAKAHIELGFAYFNGLGVTKDIVQAYMWFSVASVLGSEDGSSAQGALQKRMTSTQIDQGFELARMCIRQKYVGCGR